MSEPCRSLSQCRDYPCAAPDLCFPQPKPVADAPVMTKDEQARLAKQIRDEGIGLLDLLDEARWATLDAASNGTVVNPRPLQEAALAVWLEVHYPGGRAEV